MAAKIAEQLKERGNAHFKLAEYDSAILCYSQAITKNPDNAVFFTNRANAKLKIKDWSGAMDDCIRSITLSRNNLKAFWHLAVAQLELNHPSEALTSAMTAYDLCSNSTQQTSSAFHISAFVLKCKKAKWDMREADRLRRRSELLWKCEVYLENETAKEVQDVETRFRNMEIGQVGRSEELDEIKKNGRDKVDELRTVFALANPGLMEKREVPEHLIDDISFEIMHDPVVTIHGHSYERATITEHLKRNPIDPLTRKPLRVQDLRPNIALKKACDEFWENNKGWAYDW